MGECSRCGECCRYIILGPVKVASPAEKEYFKARGAIEKGGFYLIPYSCPNLMRSQVEGMVFECAIYETRPRICELGNLRKTVHGHPCYIPECCTLIRK